MQSRAPTLLYAAELLNRPDVMYHWEVEKSAALQDLAVLF